MDFYYHSYTSQKKNIAKESELYKKTSGSRTVLTSSTTPALSDAPLQVRSWAHLAQPTEQQEQQLFLQKVHLHFLHFQEPAQVQEPQVARTSWDSFGAEVRLEFQSKRLRGSRDVGRRVEAPV